MSRHYSPKRFFREVPADPLSIWRDISRKKLLADFDFTKLEESGVDTLNRALETLPEEPRNEIEQDFSEIDSLACEGGRLKGFQGNVVLKDY